MVRPSADLYTLRAIPRINSSHVRVLGRLSAMRTFRKLLFSPKVPREPQTPASKPPRPNEENLRYNIGGYHPVSIGDPSRKEGTK